jgi:hypothetical protein
MLNCANLCFDNLLPWQKDESAANPAEVKATVMKAAEVAADDVDAPGISAEEKGMRRRFLENIFSRSQSYDRQRGKILRVT